MKIVSLSLALAALIGGIVFGDDANVLPAGVMRLRVVPAFATLDKSYDKDGKAVDSSLAGSLVVGSAALEFGVVDQVTAGIQWAPGYYLSSNVTKVPAELLALVNNSKLVVSGPDDLQIGAKIELLGPKGFAANDQIRVALTPGFSLPLDKYDGKAEATNFAEKKDYRLAGNGHGSLGVGIKADLDYLVSPMFYLNLHGQAFQYGAKEETGFSDAIGNVLTYKGALAAGATAAQAQTAADASAPVTKTKTAYGLEYAVELEPHFTFDLGEGANIGLGLPVTYHATMETTATTAGKDVKEDPTNVLTIKPYASCFAMLGPLPVELQVEYDLPVAGKLEKAGGTFLAQFKLFYKFY